MVYLQARQTLQIHQVHQIQKAEVANRSPYSSSRKLRVHQAQVPRISSSSSSSGSSKWHHPVRHQIMKRPKKVREHQVLLTRVQAKDMNRRKNQAVNLRVLNTVAVKAMTAAMNNKDKITKKVLKLLDLCDIISFKAEYTIFRKSGFTHSFIFI